MLCKERLKICLKTNRTLSRLFEICGHLAFLLKVTSASIAPYASCIAQCRNQLTKVNFIIASISAFPPIEVVKS